HEIHAPSGGGRAVADREVIIRERVQTFGRVEEVAGAVGVARLRLGRLGVGDPLECARAEHQREDRRAPDAAQMESHTIWSSAGGSPSISAGLCLSMWPIRPL